MSSTSSNPLTDPRNDESHQLMLMLMLRTAYFALRRKSNAFCKDSHCNWDQLVVLSILCEQSEGVTQQFICEESGYDPVTLGTMLKTMERHGLLERKPHPVDRRAKLVHTTTGGRRTFRKLWHDSFHLRDTFIGCMSQNRRKHAFKILSLIADAMNSLEI